MLHLHDYQTDIKRRLAEAWRDYRSVMVQMPTGTGKTHVLAAIVNEELGKKEGGAKEIWIIAHRRELVAQIEETLGRYWIGLGNGRIKVVSILWLSRHWEDVEDTPPQVKVDILATLLFFYRRWQTIGFTAVEKLHEQGVECPQALSVFPFFALGHLLWI